MCPSVISHYSKSGSNKTGGRVQSRCLWKIQLSWSWSIYIYMLWEIFSMFECSKSEVTLFIKVILIKCTCLHFLNSSSQKRIHESPKSNTTVSLCSWLSSHYWFWSGWPQLLLEGSVTVSLTRCIYLIMNYKSKWRPFTLVSGPPPANSRKDPDPTPYEGHGFPCLESGKTLPFTTRIFLRKVGTVLKSFVQGQCLYQVITAHHGKSWVMTCWFHLKQGQKYQH